MTFVFAISSECCK